LKSFGGALRSSLVVTFPARRRLLIALGSAGLVVAVAAALAVRGCAYQPPNMYYPYLPTKANALARVLAPPDIGLFCVPPQVLAGFGEATADELLTVARCETRLNPNLRLEGNVTIDAFGDDAAHVYALHAELRRAATSPALRSRLARAAVAAVGELDRDGELLRWLTTVEEVDEEFKTRRTTATLLVNEPDERSFAIESTDSETLGRFAGGLQPGNSLDAIEERVIARAFAPTFLFDGGDYLPVSIDVLPGRAQLCVKKGGSVDRPSCEAFERFPPEKALREQPPRGGEWVLDLPPAERDAAAYAEIEREVRAAEPRPTVYWHVARLGNYRRIVQYWVYYLFNDWENKHEGDWEVVMADLLGWTSPGTATVLRWFYSAHERGTVRTCSSGGDCVHPNVYVARGSHANYVEPGTYEVTALCRKSGHCVVPPGKDEVRGDERAGPDDYDLVELTEPGFPGRYGPVNLVPVFPDADAPDDPRGHGEWARDPLKKFVEAPGLEPDPRRWFVIDVEGAAESD
jgi:hypothetical protein